MHIHECGNIHMWYAWLLEHVAFVSVLPVNRRLICSGCPAVLVLLLKAGLCKFVPGGPFGERCSLMAPKKQKRTIEGEPSVPRLHHVCMGE